MDQKQAAETLNSTTKPAISFASTVASAATGTTSPSGNKPEARTIIFGAYNSPSSSSQPHSQTASPARQNGAANKAPSGPTKNSGFQNKPTGASQYVYIPRTQSAPPKENEIVPNPVPAQPPTATVQVSAPKTTVGGFHLDAAPYNPNAPIYMPGATAPTFVQASPYYPPPAVSGFVRPSAIGFVPRPIQIPTQPILNQSATTTPAQLDAPVAAAVQPPAPTLPPRQPSKALKIVDPKTKQELKLETIPKVTPPATATSEMTISAPEPTASSKALPIVDPSSHKPIVIAKDEHGQVVKDMSSVEQALNALTFDDDDVSDVSSEESDEFDDSGLLRHGQKITYPEKYLAYETPAVGGVWRYSRRFLIQFMPVCTQKPDKSSFFSRVARKENQSGRGRRQKRILTEAEREAIMMSLNKTANAWAPVADETTLAEEERILREAKGILNKLTMEKFDVLSDKIIALGITSQNVQGGMIDLLFDKSTDEPKFASMYAMLCLKIALKDLEESRSSTDLRTTSSASSTSSAKAESKFRRLLLEKCQYEFRNKRDWSSKRQAASEARPKSASSGELTDEDYELIKVKRRVLGNMRFIGELFMQGLLGEKIMHMIINELSQNLENPEEDEVECLCKVLATVGKRLDHGESIQIMDLYMARMKAYNKHKKLNSRIRFACLDVIELRSRGWLSKEEPLQTLAQVQQSQQPAFSSPSSMTSSDNHAPRRTSSKGEHRDRDHQERRISGDYRTESSRDRPRLMQRQSSVDDGQENGWKVSSSSSGSGWDTSSRSKPQAGRSFTIKELKEQQPRANSPQTAAIPSTQSPTPTAQPFNRFHALDEQTSPVSKPEEHQEQTHQEVQQEQEAPAADDKAVFKAMAMYDEYVAVNSMEGLLERVAQIPKAELAAFCQQLLLKVIDSPKVYFEKFPVFIASSRDLFESANVWSGVVHEVSEMLDDISVDVPNAYSVFSSVLRCLSEQSLLSGKDAIACLSDKMSLVGRFKVTGYVSCKRLDSLPIEVSKLTPMERKNLGNCAVRQQWYKQSAIAAELAFYHRIEQTIQPQSNPSFFFASAKAIISSDFLNSSLAPLRGLSIVLHFGFAELAKNPTTDGVEMMLALASPFLNDLAVAQTPHAKIEAVVREASGEGALADAFLSHLKR